VSLSVNCQKGTAPVKTLVLVFYSETCWDERTLDNY